LNCPNKPVACNAVAHNNVHDTDINISTTVNESIDAINCDFLIGVAPTRLIIVDSFQSTITCPKEKSIADIVFIVNNEPNC
jgi:hypothetical protein